tara:strand:- start:1832 stop:1990 length:159 start_codon:yes stop_codon:yes gene_type:complete
MGFKMGLRISALGCQINCLPLVAAKPSPLRMVALFYSGRYLFYKLPQPNQTN